jgi:O-antigen/teichoic acid export membrane protein
MRGIGAAALGPIVTVAIQLGSVPLLLHAWGASKYGDWLLLSAIPSYLTFSGLGFGDSSGSDMTMRVAGGDWEGALATFQSSWVLLSAMSMAVLATAAIGVWWLPWQQILHLAGVTSGQAAWVVLFLAGWILAVQQWSILESGYRCDGNFALGNCCTTMQRLVEAAVATAIGIITGSLLLVSVAYLGSRLAGLIFYRLLLRQISPWLTLGVKRASVAVVRRMLKPSLGFIAMPLGSAVSIQGFLMVVGIVLGPIAVTAFSTARTLTRVGSLMINCLAGGMWPEFSSAFGARNLSLARKLHRYAFQSSLIISVCCAAFLWVLGPTLYHFWVRNSVDLNIACFRVLLLVTIANSLWFVSATVQMSANRHSRLAVVYLAAAAASCALGYELAQRLGLFGCALALLLVDVAMCAFVLRTSLEQMQDTEFWRAVLGSAPQFLRPGLASRLLRR